MGFRTLEGQQPVIWIIQSFPRTSYMMPADMICCTGMICCSGTHQILPSGFRTAHFLEILCWRHFLGEGHAESRFRAMHGTRLTPFVGRGEELNLVLSCWQQAKERSGQVVLLSGEPGIGKSRLVLSLRERLHDEPKATVSYACSPHHVHSALFVFKSQLERSLGFLPADSSETRLGRLESLLRETVEEPDDALASDRDIQQA
jgi:hypothetical protein